eukprot:CAMPEP_0181304662 /NCGR_PEP_ID=MMETSP1101-20121128/9280_1 /TAXON_ID=46948 /ORGANISM="Rhodomonas abbreviata, Strain Caron Lab Isolate" /LENGTH=235 /DNA_ID=CAMNT_0023410455 /DNA_START=337 /DNA_END=1044 /DNA_ORIENTATION=-
MESQAPNQSGMFPHNSVHARNTQESGNDGRDFAYSQAERTNDGRDFAYSQVTRMPTMLSFSMASPPPQSMLGHKRGRVSDQYEEDIELSLLKISRAKWIAQAVESLQTQQRARLDAEDALESWGQCKTDPWWNSCSSFGHSLGSWGTPGSPAPLSSSTTPPSGILTQEVSAWVGQGATTDSARVETSAASVPIRGNRQASADLECEWELEENSLGPGMATRAPRESSVLLEDWKL